MKILKMMMLAAALSCAALFTLRATAQEEKASATLKPGDPAPKLQVDKWVKGEPVKELEKGKVYVLEYWATWCGPCVTAIPHVTEIQKKYKDKGLVVIGVNVWERDASAVEPFVKKMGDKMDYRVATDVVESDPNEGKMAVTWMKAAGRSGIPTSFVVDRELKVAWIGHPMSMDSVVEQVVAGKFDAKKQAELEAKREELEQQFGEAMRGKDFPKALKAVDEIIAADPSGAKMYRNAKLMVLLQSGDRKGAHALVKEMTSGEGAKDQQTLLSAASTLLNQPAPDKSDADVALGLAEKAEPMGGEMAVGAMMLQAKAYAAKGEYDKAVEHQTRAHDKADDENMKRFLKRDLDKYKGLVKETPAEEKPAEKKSEKK